MVFNQNLRECDQTKNLVEVTMSVIYLIRHGQASFSNRDYDQLSETGITQATVLGQALKHRKTVPALIYGGSMKRHHQTAHHCTKALDPQPQYTENTDWNEYDHMELIAKHQPDLASFDQLTAYIKQQEQPMKMLQRLLNNAIQDWMTDTYDYTTTWSNFKDGVWSSLTELASNLDKHETAWVFTSGGPITVAMIQLLGLQEEQFMALQGRIVNSSITKILVGKSGLSLSTYNEYSHLESESNLITYR